MAPRLSPSRYRNLQFSSDASALTGVTPNVRNLEFLNSRFHKLRFFLHRFCERKPDGIQNQSKRNARKPGARTDIQTVPASLNSRQGKTESSTCFTAASRGVVIRVRFMYRFVCSTSSRCRAPMSMTSSRLGRSAGRTLASSSLNRNPHHMTQCSPQRHQTVVNEALGEDRSEC